MVYTKRAGGDYFIKVESSSFSQSFTQKGDKTELLALEVFNELCERTSVKVLDTLTKDEINYIEASNSKDGFILAKHLRFTQMVETGNRICLKLIQMEKLNGERRSLHLWHFKI